MAKETPKVIEQNPQAGGSFVRNEDGSLAVNEADAQKIPAVEVTAETAKE